VKRRSAFHALNHKAIARRYAKEKGKNYEDLRLVVAHLGGGISVGAHKYGRVVDVFDAVAEGTFSPERCGSVPCYNIIELSFSGKHDAKELLGYQVGKGGMVAYLGTSDMREVEKMINDGDEKAKLTFDAMIHQLSKDIGAMCAVLDGEVDAILLTGGIAYSEMLVAAVTKKVGKFAPISVYPGEGEMRALTEGALRAVRGETPVKEYKG
jgi:butyrate kinase